MATPDFVGFARLRWLRLSRCFVVKNSARCFAATLGFAGFARKVLRAFGSNVLGRFALLRWLRLTAVATPFKVLRRQELCKVLRGYALLRWLRAQGASRLRLQRALTLRLAPLAAPDCGGYAFQGA